MRRSRPFDRRKRHRHSRSRAFRRVWSIGSFCPRTRSSNRLWPCAPSKSIKRHRDSSRWCTPPRGKAAISSTDRNATFVACSSSRRLTFSKDHWLGQHVFKVGLDFQRSRFDGDHYSQQLDVVRLDGSLAERTTYSPSLTHPEVVGTEFAIFAQDRWRVNDQTES